MPYHSPSRFFSDISMMRGCWWSSGLMGFLKSARLSARSAALPSSVTKGMSFLASALHRSIHLIWLCYETIVIQLLEQEEQLVPCAEHHSLERGWACTQTALDIRDEC